MFCDFYSFHDKVDFCVRDTGSKMLKFKYEFSFTYKGLTFKSFCKSYFSIQSSDHVEYPYMMRKRAVNHSMTYRLCFDIYTYVFTLNQEFNELFEKWLGQFPICIDLD